MSGADPSTEARNYRVLYPSSPAIDSGDPGLAQFDDNGYFPLDEFDVDADAEDEEVTPALTSKRVLGEAEAERIDRGAYEVPCFIPACIADIVDTVTLQPPPDGLVDGADLAYVIGEWGPGPSLADIVDTVTLQPPPDGEVDGADLAVVIGNWGPCPTECQDPYAESMMMIGSTNPFENTELGDLLDQLIETSDAELAETVAALLAEWLAE